MNTPNWLDSTLWSISRAYRRRKIRQSRVMQELRTPISPDDRYLDTPAILARGQPAEQALGRAQGETMWHFPKDTDLNRYRPSPHLVEKLTDEAMMHGSWPPSGQAMEYWCEHCPQYGHCSICGQDHAGGVA